MISHIGSDNRPKMVDVSKKSVTRRTAHARSVVRFPPELVAVDDSGEIQSKKGPVFQTAIIAGVMAAKKTHELVPFCHPLRLEDCQIMAALSVCMRRLSPPARTSPFIGYERDRVI